MNSTKLKILKAGIRLWREDPSSVNALRIAKRIGMVHSSVLYHYPRDSVKDAVAAYAVEIGEPKIIPQLIVMGHDAIKDMPMEERQMHLILPQ